MKMSREKITKKIEYWQKMLDVWDRCEPAPQDDVHTAAFKIYVRDQSVRDLRKKLIAAGYKIPYDMRISDLITKGTIEDKEIEAVGKGIFKANKQHNPHL